MSWRAFFTLTVTWEVFVFYPVAHWMWGAGWLGNEAGIGALDFAGGIVIHTRYLSLNLSIYLVY